MSAVLLTTVVVSVHSSVYGALDLKTLIVNATNGILFVRKGMYGSFAHIMDIQATAQW
jgi:hypothetical protein